MEIRSASLSDLRTLIVLNDTEVPHVTRLDEELAERLLDEADVFLVAVDDLAEPIGFLVGLPPGLSYRSPNYGWFVERVDRFLYVDRLVVAPDRRGEGIGRSLYEAAFEAAGDAPVTCEVNIRPPNPGSMAFHRRLGFQEVGRLVIQAGRKEVSLLMRPPVFRAPT